MTDTELKEWRSTWDSLLKDPWLGYRSCLEDLESGLTKQLPKNEDQKIFWKFIREVEEKARILSAENLIHIYLTTAFGLSEDLFICFQNLHKSQIDFTFLDIKRRPRYLKFFHELLGQSHIPSIAQQGENILTRAGLAGVLIACFCMNRALPGKSFTDTMSSGYSPWGPRIGVNFVAVNNEQLITVMLQAANIKNGETVMDPGSGDGRILLCAAEKFSAKTIGIEYNPFLVQLSRWRVKYRGLKDRIKIVWADMFSQNLSSADVITIFLTEPLLEELSFKKFATELKPSCRVISLHFSFPNQLGRYAIVNAFRLPSSELYQSRFYIAKFNPSS